MTNIYDDVVRNNIKKIIKQKGYKQCCVAEKAGIERNLFYRLLSNQAFDSKYIIPICKALNCKPNLNALAKINHQLSGASESEKEELISKKLELEEKIEDTEKAIKDVDYREANKRAGYVYIISNIGAFGENVYKIGMTRRLDPMERVYELGDASVPFNFDVHAMIFSDDAPKLENALHKAFEDRKLNMVNQRREFFNVTLDEIKKVVKENYDKTVEFIDLPEAEQYRVSEKMRKDTVHV